MFRKLHIYKSMKKNTLFIISILLIIVVLDISMFLEEKKISIIENRELNQFEHLTINDYISGDYQEGLEKAINDQVLFSDVIKRIQSVQKWDNVVKRNFNNIFSFSNRYVDKIGLCKNKYVFMGNINLGESNLNLYSYNCDKRIVYNTNNDYSAYQKRVKKIINSYKNLFAN